MRVPKQGGREGRFRGRKEGLEGREGMLGSRNRFGRQEGTVRR
jgi:predicted transposase YdaD